MISIHKLEDVVLRRDPAPVASGLGLVNFTIQLQEDKLDGGWIAECLDLPGCVSDGDTVDEALQHLTEAITGVLSVRLQQHARQVTCEIVNIKPDAATPRRVALAL